MSKIRLSILRQEHITEDDLISETDLIIGISQTLGCYIGEYDSLSLAIQIMNKSHYSPILIFISKDDKFNSKSLIKVIHSYCNEIVPDLTLLVPYVTPPEYTMRIEKGKVQSFIISQTVLKRLNIFKYTNNFWSFAYGLTYAYLNSNISQNIEILQVGKPATHIETSENYISYLRNSLLIIPHKGSVKLLTRCLHHLNLLKIKPQFINICFDDYSFKKVRFTLFGNIKKHLSIYLNAPLNVGPYLPRHYSVKGTKSEYVFFQDSDDVSVNSRFSKQISALKKGNLDMIGSHELRIDQFAKCIKMIRYPILVPETNSINGFYPLLHPTSMITTTAYKLAGGFSTNLKFGLDSQFMFRALFFLKMGNVDDFLYIRFRRPSSLTTSSKTKLSSDIRKFYFKRWIIDYNLIKQNKLELVKSSLALMEHEFVYKLENINLD